MINCLRLHYANMQIQKCILVNLTDSNEKLFFNYINYTLQYYLFIVSISANVSTKIPTFEYICLRKISRRWRFFRTVSQDEDIRTYLEEARELGQ